jgi:hypothetical protein
MCIVSILAKTNERGGGGMEGGVVGTNALQTFIIVLSI